MTHSVFELPRVGSLGWGVKP